TAVWLATASIVGLAVGVVVPAAHQVRPLALGCLFVQTFVAIGAMGGPRQTIEPKRVGRMLVHHHLYSSLPLIVLGLALGLDTWIGAGAFLLGAVPPANAIASYVAVTRGHVDEAIAFTIGGYVLAVVVTPTLVFAAFGSSHSLDSLALTLGFGLVLPVILGHFARPLLLAVPRRMCVAVMSSAALVLMLGLGAELRIVWDLVAAQPRDLALALAVGLGRCVWSGLYGWFGPADVHRRLDSMITATCKNCVLAAVIATSAAGMAAALPALLALWGEALVLLTAAAIVAHGDRRRTAAKRKRKSP
ncbi:hypothetical protein, partial [uncultured Aeromicrobium sp.]|uniref:hypothetical protein n=1 Tax=uncultured Aeromicrobium sp. TaxID=337820 RepID=UPI0025DF861E